MRSPRRTIRRWWLGPTTVFVAWTGLAVAALHPPAGLGVPLCLVRATIGAPCPGCGLTRSLSCAVRGDIAASVSHHPFGPVVLAIFLAIAILSLVPHRRRTPLASVHQRLLRWSAVMFAGSFVVFGAARSIVALGS